MTFCLLSAVWCTNPGWELNCCKRILTFWPKSGFARKFPAERITSLWTLGQESWFGTIFEWNLFVCMLCTWHVVQMCVNQSTSEELSPVTSSQIKFRFVLHYMLLWCGLHGVHHHKTTKHFINALLPMLIGKKRDERWSRKRINITTGRIKNLPQTAPGWWVISLPVAPSAAPRMTGLKEKQVNRLAVTNPRCPGDHLTPSRDQKGSLALRFRGNAAFTSSLT